MIETRNGILIKLISILVMSTMLFISIWANLKNIIALYVVFVSLILALFSWRNKYKFVVYGLMAYFNYSICSAQYLRIIDNTYTKWANDDVSYIAIRIMLVFVTFLIVSYRYDSKDNQIELFDDNKSCLIISLSLNLIIVFLLVREIILSFGSGRGSVSSMYEYAVIIFIISFIYSKDNIQRKITVLLLFAYALRDILSGNRACALQMIIMFALIFWLGKYTIKQSIPFIMIGITVFTMVGGNREQTNFSLNSIVTNMLRLLSGGGVNDTAYSAYFTSMTFIKVCKSLSWSDRFDLFLQFIKSCFLGSSVVKNSSLSLYTHSVYAHDYGGVLPFYFFFYLGYFGVTLIAFYVNILLNSIQNRINSSGNRLQKGLIVYIVSTMPRWYLYGPLPLFRGILLFSVLYGACEVLRNNILQKSN